MRWMGTWVSACTRLLATGIALLLGTACGGAPPAIQPTPLSATATATATVRPMPAGTTLVYYDIVGSTETELKAQLSALAPISQTDGRRHAANTTATYRWSWPGFGSAACNLGASEVTVEIQVTMPRWTPPPGASRRLIEKWNRFVDATDLHELGHVEIAESNVSTITQAIASATCSSADAGATEALGRIQDRHVQYDRDTDNGVKQGAFFR